MKKIVLTREEIETPKGLGIEIEGFRGNPVDRGDEQIYIEYYEGNILVHIWNGKQDPITIKIKPTI